MEERMTDTPLKKITRRDVIKSLATMPVLGLFSWQTLKKNRQAALPKEDVLKKLGFKSKSPALIDNNHLGEKSPLLRIGIIGTGPRGMSLLESLGYRTQKDIHKVTKNNISELKAWVKNDDLNVELTAVCDVFDLRAEMALAASRHSRSAYASNTTLPGAKRYKNYRQLLDDPRIDGVLIATPDHHHAPMAVDAILAGKHVYLEKALSRTEAEVFQLEKIVKENDRVFQLGHQYRHSPIFKQAKNLIRQNILGPVSLVETTTNRNTLSGAWTRHYKEDGSLKPGGPQTIDWQQWLGNAPKVPFSLDRFYGWTKWFDYGNGPWGQLFSHEYDAVNALLDLGIPKSCVASGGIYYWRDGRETPDVFNAVFEYPDKHLTLLFSLTLSNGRKRGRVLMGRDATMEVGGSLIITPDPSSSRYKKEMDTGVLDASQPLVALGPDARKVDALTSATAKYYAERGLSKTMINGEQLDLTYLHIKDWLNAIRFGGRTSCPIDVSVNEMITILMATKSYREKRRVEWDAVNRRII